MREQFHRSVAKKHRCDLVFVLTLIAFSLFPFIASKAQDSPILKIDDDITRFAYSSSGRIVFATRHVFSVKKIQLQRDDIWICETDGKKRRILQGDKFVRGSGPFSYTIRALRWSPDGNKIAAELATSEMTNDDGDTRESVKTLLLDDTGREITLAGTDSMISGASSATWQTDGVSVVYLKEQLQAQTPAAESPIIASAANKLFTINRLKALSGGETVLFQGHSLAAVAWNTTKDSGVGVEREPGIAGASKLVALDLISETSRALGTLEGYAGGLSLSPSGKRAAYWIDNGQLEVRSVDAPNQSVRLHVPIGTLDWSGDETRVLVKRGAAARSGSLAWFTLPSPSVVTTGTTPATAEVTPQSILHDLEFRQFDVSPDGKSLAVVEPGKRNLLVYPLS